MHTRRKPCAYCLSVGYPRLVIASFVRRWRPPNVRNADGNAAVYFLVPFLARPWLLPLRVRHDGFDCSMPASHLFHLDVQHVVIITMSSVMAPSLLRASANPLFSMVPYETMFVISRRDRHTSVSVSALSPPRAMSFGRTMPTRVRCEDSQSAMAISWFHLAELMSTSRERRDSDSHHCRGSIRVDRCRLRRQQ